MTSSAKSIIRLPGAVALAIDKPNRSLPRMKTTSQRIQQRQKTAPRAAAQRPPARITPFRTLSKVVVIGLDQVGLDLAFHFARCGIDVVGIDPSSSKVRAIQTLADFRGGQVSKGTVQRFR